MGSEHYSIALRDVCGGAQALRPPRRVTVADGARDSLVIKQPGGYVGPWSADETPYMVEPMNMLASRRHEAVCFVGPARTGKTLGLLDAWMSYAVTCDPGDMLIVQMTQDKAREFSKTRIDRAIRHSPALAAMLSASRQDDNTHDKQFRNGMWLRIGWPTVSQLSSSDYRYVALTDYDRMPTDVDGEGSAFALGLKRTTTFLSRGMCMVESSPGYEIKDPNWNPITAHEAPPTEGIVGIYNRSDRRRWYWTCFDCSEWFEAAPGLRLFNLPSDEELLSIVREADLGEMAGRYARVACPHCGSIIEARYKQDLNRRGRWLQDGLKLTASGEVVGEPASSTIAGYWLGGVAASYQSWKSLVERYLQALREYALSGSELALQVTVNTDQGMPYMSRLLAEAAKGRGGPESRAEPDLERYVVPDEARFLVATVDVQGGTGARFVVQVHAVGPFGEKWIVDRFAITESEREGLGGNAPIDPASYLEDWNLLTEKVVRATYRTSHENIELRVRMTVVDSGGEDGVTDKAYGWYRKLRREHLHHKVMLVKGASAKGTPLIKESWVGGRNRQDKGDIPLYILNANMLKDTVSTNLRRRVPGPGYLHLPGWLNKAFYDELNAEVREANGTWKQIRKRNEAFDLLAYCEAGILRLGADKLKDWSNAPGWAKPVPHNAECMTREDRREMKANALTPEGRDDPAERLRPVRPKKVGRRTSVSSYLG
jgi:phage terminase large subunit GpA-like protein